MEEAGQKLKTSTRAPQPPLSGRRRSQSAHRRAPQNDEFIMALSRLSDIENRAPFHYIPALLSCAIYRVDLAEVLEWYGVRSGSWGRNSGERGGRSTVTHHMASQPDSQGRCCSPFPWTPASTCGATTYLSRMISAGGKKLPLMLLNGNGPEGQRYGLWGRKDWSMYRLLAAGSRWSSTRRGAKSPITPGQRVRTRPIYSRTSQGSPVARCNLMARSPCWLQPPPRPQCQSEMFVYPDEIDIIGQGWTAVAMRLIRAGDAVLVPEQLRMSRDTPDRASAHLAGPRRTRLRYGVSRMSTSQPAVRGFSPRHLQVQTRSASAVPAGTKHSATPLRALAEAPGSASWSRKAWARRSD